jgi:hypothetical protein
MAGNALEREQTPPRPLPDSPQWAAARQRILHYLHYLDIEGNEAEAFCELTLQMAAWKSPRIGEAEIPGAAMRALESVLAQRGGQGRNWRADVWARCNGALPNAAPELDRITPAIRRRHMRPASFVSMPSKPRWLRRLFPHKGG